MSAIVLRELTKRWGPVTANGTAVVMSACNEMTAWYWDPQSWTFRW